jgi:hypothetical protein
VAGSARTLAGTAVAGVVLAGSVVAGAGAAAAPPPAPPATLAPGQALLPGQSLGSGNGQWVLTLTGSGDLEESTGGVVAWSTGTDQAGSVLRMQGDGNLVLYAPSGRPLWASATENNPGAELTVTDTGSLQVSQYGALRWQNDLATDLLRPDQPLEAGWSVTSANGLYTLTVLPDGSLVEYLATPQWRGALWQVNGVPGSHAVMQGDGNLVLYSPSGQALWSTATGRHPGAELLVRNDTQMQVLDGPTPLWQADPATLRTDIVTIADSRLGYRDDPAGTFCNVFSAYWGGGSSCGDGRRAEPWCADFAAWVWHAAGVRFTYGWAPGDLSASAASFYSWASRTGNWHWAGSGYVPRPGDVAVFGLNASHTYADHVAVVVTPGSPGVDAINGDAWWGNDGGVAFAVDEATATGTDTLSGYASP